MAFPPHRIMACTRADLDRWLREFSDGALRLGADGDATIPLDGGGTIRLTTSPVPVRQVALIVLPRLDVRFDFEPECADAALAWLRRFDRHTQRGGG